LYSNKCFIYSGPDPRNARLKIPRHCWYFIQHFITVVAINRFYPHTLSMLARTRSRSRLSHERCEWMDGRQTWGSIGNCQFHSGGGRIPNRPFYSTPSSWPLVLLSRNLHTVIFNWIEELQPSSSVPMHVTETRGPPICCVVKVTLHRHQPRHSRVIKVKARYFTTSQVEFTLWISLENVNACSLVYLQ